MSTLVTCSMCGYSFDPAAHPACRSCPLNSGCQVVCCPSCGFQWADPAQSSLARLASRWLSRVKSIDKEGPSLPERKPS